MESAEAKPLVAVSDAGEALWFLGTFIRVKLDGRQSGGRLGVFDTLLPRGTSPPLHSHPQDETLCILDGEVTAWVVEEALAASDHEQPPAWVAACARHCSSGAVVYAPGGTPHTFRVESDTARMLTLSTPAGIEEFARALGEPAQWPWLPPPPDGPRVAADRLASIEQRFGMVRHGPPPPPAA